MKEIPQQAEGSKAILSPELQKLHNRVVNARKAVAKSLAFYEKAAASYQNLLQASSGKIAVLEGLYSLKIAKFSYKIKKAEFKLAQAALKFAKKDLKKSERTATKEAVRLKKRQEKDSAKGGKRGAPAKG